MMGRTHALLGTNTLWIFEVLGGLRNLAPEAFPILVLAAAFGALVPDLDASYSLLQGLALAGIRPFVLPAQALHARFGHRGFLHSLLAWGIWICITSPTALINNLLWYALILGYASHLLGDCCTRSGLRLLYPSRRAIHFLPKGLRMSTGSQAEEVVFVLLSLTAVLHLLQRLKMAF